LQGGKPFKYYCHGRFHTSLFHCIVINETSTVTPKMEWRCQNAFTISPLIKTTWRLFFAGLFTPCTVMVSTCMVQLICNTLNAMNAPTPGVRFKTL
jgi:uncharacterized membrane protein